MLPRLCGRFRASRPWVGALVVLALAGCGGGFYLGDRFGDDELPQVSLAVSPDSAEPGDTLRLVAAASDDSGIESVSFFRVDGNMSTLLDEDDTAPFALDTVVPDGASGTVEYFARALDNDGDTRDSDRFSVSVDP